MSEPPQVQSDTLTGGPPENQTREDLVHQHVRNAEDHISTAPDYRGGPQEEIPQPRPLHQQRPRPPPMNRNPPSQWPIQDAPTNHPPPRNYAPRDGAPMNPDFHGRRPPPRGPPRYPPPRPHYRPPPHQDPRYRNPAYPQPPYNNPIPRPPPHSRFNNYPPQFRPRPPPSRPPHLDPRYSGYSTSQYSRSTSAHQVPDVSSASSSTLGDMPPPPRNPQRLGPPPRGGPVPRFAPPQDDQEEATGPSERLNRVRSLGEESFEYSDYYGDESRRESGLESGLDSDNTPREEKAESDLVRSASLGQSMKPSVTTIKHNDLQPQGHDDSSSSPPTPPTPEIREPSPLVSGPPAIREAEDQTPPKSPPEPIMGGNVDVGRSQDESNRTSGIARLFKSGVGLLRPQSSSETMTNLRPKSSHESFTQGMSDGAALSTTPKSPGSPPGSAYLTPPAQPRSPLLAPESRFSRGEVAPDGSPNAGLGLFSAQQQSTGDVVGSRPDRLTVDGPKEEELRASTTSLQGLIKRSLRLASNLERGKTSSKFGLDWMTGESPTRPTVTTRQSSGSLNGMLNKAGSPAAPQYDEKDWGQQSALRQVENNSRNGSKEPRRRGKRRCCGMPLWAFILVLVLIIILVAAAVLIPVFLIVMPAHNGNSDADSTPTGGCTSPLSCENGGTNVPGPSGTCQCLCSNGFAGDTCTITPTDGCTSTQLGDLNSVQIGSAIPAVLDGAVPTYDIPLNGTEIYNLFQAAHMSCTSQNALVTFNGLASRSISQSIQARQSFDATPEVLNFARTAVLYIGQASSTTQSAIDAQSSLQAFIRQPAGQVAQQVVVGAGWVVDLVGWTVSGGGAVVGGKGSNGS